ncbi:phage holin family protein [Paenibacillus fonticola]|uniref:phage holin family protein n=1 Tax=Paenibacillus fonticola TaxID=379896 RepID=UPI000374957C|nr:phage holin family protein [Paenibacillus fonticola]
MALYIKLLEIKHLIFTYLKPLTTKEIGFYGIFGLIGSMIAQTYGGWSPAMTLLIILMGSDYITGILASLKEGRGIASAASFWGLIKKGLMLLAVLIAHHVDLVMNTNAVMIGSIYFWYANEIISLAENYGRLELPFPEFIKEKIAMLKGKEKNN